MASYSDQGVVLRTIRLGEADRIITLATPEHGKVRAVAKGIRRTRSRFGGRLEPMTHVSVTCWKGRELDVVTGAEAIGHFKGIRADLEKVPVAFTMLEAIDHVAVERQPMPEAFRLLVGALATLDKGAGPVLLGAFLLKLLVLEGVGPSTDRCARCTKEAVLVAFDPEAGGFLCRDCRSGRAVPQETMALVRQVLGGELRTALGAPASRTTADFERLVMLGTEHHLERRLRSASSSVVKGTLHQRDLSQEPA